MSKYFKWCDACGKSESKIGKQINLYTFSSACKDQLCYECMEEFRA